MKLCLRALRLMNLDQRDDWPCIDDKTFRAASHKERVEGAEWLMFHLFEQWNADDAKNVRSRHWVLLDYLLS